MWLRDPLLALGVLVLAGAVGSAASAGNGDFLWNDVGAASGGTHAIASDGDGGVIVATDSGGIYVQRLDSSGTPLWTSGGVQLASAGDNPAIAGDPYWGATVAWEQSDGIYVQRVNLSGTPQWTAGGVKVASASSLVPLVVHGTASLTIEPGTFIAFVAPSLNARIAYVDKDGLVTAPGVDGIMLGGQVRLALSGYIRMVSDDDGGVIVLWADIYKDIVAQRVNAGLPWGSTPTVVSNDARNEGPLAAAPDGSGGALVSWSALLLSPANAQIRAQRIDENGNSLWTSNGVVVVDSATVGGNQSWWTSFTLESDIAPDEAGGAIVAWNDWRNAGTSTPGNDDLYAQRLNASGAKLWTPSNGVLLPPYISGSTAPGSQRAPRVVSDGIGGAVVTYMDLGGNSWDISATRLDADGSQHWSKYVFTDFGDPTEYHQRWPELVFDGSGSSPQGAVIAWDDQGASVDIRAEKIDLSSPTNDEPAGAMTVGVGGIWGTLGLATPTAGLSGCHTSSPDLWYRFDSASAGTLRVDTCGTHDGGGLRVDRGMDTVLALYSLGATTEYSCNDDWPSSADTTRCSATDTGSKRDSYVERTLGAGESVLIRMSRYPSSASGPFVLRVEFQPTATACSDGIDNDSDGLTDFSGGDPGCTSASDSSEKESTLPCDDGVDNDGDGRIDFDPVTFANPGNKTTLPSGSGDPGCHDPSWGKENPQCQDGIDNPDDTDGKRDYDAGYSANGSPHPSGPDPQCIGKPWKNRECGLGAELALVLPSLMWLYRRRSRGA
jgi:hypothetical protein